jgi:hypothetical protein
MSADPKPAWRVNMLWCPACGWLSLNEIDHDNDQRHAAADCGGTLLIDLAYSFNGPTLEVFRHYGREAADEVSDPRKVVTNIREHLLAQHDTDDGFDDPHTGDIGSILHVAALVGLTVEHNEYGDPIRITKG